MELLLESSLDAGKEARLRGGFLQFGGRRDAIVSLIMRCSGLNFMTWPRCRRGKTGLRASKGCLRVYGVAFERSGDGVRSLSCFLCMLRRSYKWCLGVSVRSEEEMARTE